MPRPSANRRPTGARPPGSHSAARQADYHRLTRRAHEAETAEDYAEAIADLIDEQGEARVVDLARLLGVTHVTVIRTLTRLQKSGLVTSRPYRSVFLTEAGRRTAARARRRHRIVYEFLRAIGVGEDAARADAEGIEHHVGPATLRVFERFTTSRTRGR